MTSKKCPIALYFEADAYDIREKKLMGRQSAGNGFLRAIVNGMDAEKEYLLGYLSDERKSEVFEFLVHQINPDLEVRNTTFLNTAELKQAGVLYLPDPNLIDGALRRFRGSVTDFSISGVTHTTASHAAMGMIRGLATEPVMPWDALICTSQSVKNTVNTILDAEFDYLSWRLGVKAQPQICQTPVIPLGIHTKDFEFSEKQRSEARLNLGIEKHEIVFLFVGRLTTFMKAHVYPMYASLQAVAEQTGKKITLIECGWHENDHNRDVMHEALKETAPNVKHMQIEGRKTNLRLDCWAGADVFVSLSDNIQETFGLTPVEAMAASLPIIISDWNGYRELCSEGEEGFKIPTSMIDDTEKLALNYDITGQYGRYCATAANLTAIDVGHFVEKAKLLALDPELRKAMGAKGKQRAQAVYDWSVISCQYRTLWSELQNMRLAAIANPDKFPLNQGTPNVLPSRQSPTKLFAGYPTHYVTNTSQFTVVHDDAEERYKSLSKLRAFHLPPKAPPCPRH